MEVMISAGSSQAAQKKGLQKQAEWECEPLRVPGKGYTVDRSSNGHGISRLKPAGSSFCFEFVRHRTGGCNVLSTACARVNIA
jgi:hypothetical protein